MLRQIEWGVQSGAIAINGLLPLTAWFFKKFNWSIRTSYKC